jgi:hypothetical protein
VTAIKRWHQGQPWESMRDRPFVFALWMFAVWHDGESTRMRRVW